MLKLQSRDRRPHQQNCQGTYRGRTVFSHACKTKRLFAVGSELFFEEDGTHTQAAQRVKNRPPARWYQTNPPFYIMLINHQRCKGEKKQGEHLLGSCQSCDSQGSRQFSTIWMSRRESDFNSSGQATEEWSPGADSQKSRKF